MRPDHLAVAAGSLAEGVAAVEAALGMTLEGGGQHLAMGTHNRLLGLGDVYLEVIAVDPSLPGPGRPRWFDLDRFLGPPRLTNWIAACDDLAAALADAPDGTGVPMDFARGDLRWQMAVPEDGVLPFGGAHPAPIRQGFCPTAVRF
jgi:Glyoxalase-like domain